MNCAVFLLEKSAGLKASFVAGVEEQITHHKLFVAVQALADDISRRFGSGREILLLSENNLFFIISYLAVIMSGNRVVLIETDLSIKQRETILAACLPAALFIQNKHAAKFRTAGNIFSEQYVRQVISGSGRNNLSRDFVSANPPPSEDEVAVIIFTSGSTGKKKGVMLTHKNIMANTASIISYLELTARDRMLVALPFFYCYGLSLLHTHLRVGGSLVLHRSPFLGSAIKEIKDYSCTGFAGVPATFQILTDKTNFLSEDFPSLRYLTQAGGKLADSYIDKISFALSPALFYIMYGATEATARLSYLPPGELREKAGSIGKGIPGVTLQVVDQNNQSVKPGVVGEILAWGDNIMKGYYKDPIETKKVLKDGWYYTGDLATVDSDGYIYIVGRLKNIIKVAGYRFSPQEVEEVIDAEEGVTGSVAVGIEYGGAGESLVVLVETADHSEGLKTRLFARCRKSLPAHQVPSAIFLVDQLPLTATHKVDRVKAKDIAAQMLWNQSRSQSSRI